MVTMIFNSIKCDAPGGNKAGLLKYSTIAAFLVTYAIIVAPTLSAHLCFGIVIASMLLLTIETNWTRKSTVALALNLVAMLFCLSRLIG